MRNDQRASEMTNGMARNDCTGDHTPRRRALSALGVAIIVTALVERRQVKPLAPADPNDPEWEKLASITSGNGSSSAPQSNPNPYSAPGASSYAETQIRAASRLGFSAPDSSNMSRVGSTRPTTLSCYRLLARSSSSSGGERPRRSGTRRRCCTHRSRTDGISSRRTAPSDRELRGSTTTSYFWAPTLTSS